MDRIGSTYGFGTLIDVPYEDAVPRVKAALTAEGFGVLTEIDVRQTLREKLGEAMPAYLILGACNPQLAHQALTIEPAIGLLLPCNVVVRAEGAGRTRVEIADPQAMLGIVGNAQLDGVAAEARQRLQRALATVGGSGASA
jgi:uncharacterized protein (DUF302 family)